MKRILSTLILALSLTACSQSSKEPELFDTEYKTFYIAGVSAIEGVDAIKAQLIKDGFKQHGKVEEWDMTFMGEGFTYSVEFIGDISTDKAYQLTYGLFDKVEGCDLPNGNKMRIYLEWYKDGSIKKANISMKQSNLGINPKEVNKKLSKLFPHSRISNNAFGYKTYYNDNKLELYYPNGMQISIEQK